MTVVLFMTLLVILSVAVSLCTEAVKKLLTSTKVTYSANLVVLAVSVIVGIGGTAFTYLCMGIPFTFANVVSMFLMGVAVWVGAMVGYDKVLQMVEQLKTLRLK